MAIKIYFFHIPSQVLSLDIRNAPVAMAIQSHKKSQILKLISLCDLTASPIYLVRLRPLKSLVRLSL